MASAENFQTRDQITFETRPDVRAWACYHPRLIWTLSASVSLLSTRYLLVESNFHYPTLVYLAQIFVATAVVVFQTPWRKTKYNGTTGQLRKRGIHRGTWIAFGAMCFVALSMLCMLQAILHFTNLPTLTMLIIVAIFANDFLHLLFGFSPCSGAGLLRIGVLLLACVGILATEYRLSVPALVTSIPAMLFAGIASALSKFAIRYHYEELPSPTKQMHFLIGAGYVVAAVWVLLSWPNARAITFNTEHILLLMISCASTITTFMIGNSTLLPTSELFVDEGHEHKDTHSYSLDTWNLLTLVGISGCYSTLLVRRSYTSWYQLCCFALAVAWITRKAIQDTTSIRKLQQQDRSNTYPLLHEFLSTTIEGEETRLSIEVTGTVRSHRFELDGWASRSQAIRLGVTMLTIWAFYLWFNFYNPEHAPVYTLDRGFKPAMPLELVISMYKEPIEDVRRLVSGIRTVPETSESYVTIYIKDHEADMKSVRLRTGADRVIQRPNVGREGETYLYHISDRWDSLAKHTIFLQADIHNPHEFYPRLRSYFDSTRTGFLSLGWSGVCSCEECGDRFSWSDDTRLFPYYYSKIYNSTECSSVLLSYKGQFVVSAARIRGIDKRIYNDLWHDFVDEDSWAHKPEFLRGRPDSMSAPDFGYTMERIWSLLFQCSDMSVAWRCPTLLSRWRLGGDIEDCQCFDSSPSE